MSSQRQQLKLVFSSSRKTSKNGNGRSWKSKRSPAIFSISSFQKKIGQLEQLRPAAAKVIERLVDDVLAETYWLPPLE